MRLAAISHETEFWEVYASSRVEFSIPGSTILFELLQIGICKDLEYPLRGISGQG